LTSYDGSTHEVDLLCDKFAKYEMRRRLAAAKEGKAGATSDVSLAMFSQASLSKKKEKKKRLQARYLFQAWRATSRRNAQTARRRMNEKKDNKSGEKRVDKSKATKGNEEANGTKSSSGTLYTAMSHNAFASTGEASHTPIEILRNLQRSQQPTVERSTLTVPGPCEWQHQPMAWNRR
jgi:hypothetical protein